VLFHTSLFVETVSVEHSLGRLHPPPVIAIITSGGFLLWVAALGIQVPSPIANFRFSPSDLVLLALLLLLSVTSTRNVVAALRPTRLHVLLLLLLAALALGGMVALLRTGVLVREAWLNKGVGFFVLAAVVIVVRTVVRDARGVERALATLLIGGSATIWLAALDEIITAAATQIVPGVRFRGFLLNPSANALFIATVLMVQLAFLWRPSTGRSVVWLQRINAVTLALLLVATLSRSTWLAALIALAVIWMVTRHRQTTQLIAFAVVLALAFEPLRAVTEPIVEQFQQGSGAVSMRETSPLKEPSPQVAAILDGTSTLSIPSSNWRVVSDSSSACAQTVGSPVPSDESAPAVTDRGKAERLAPAGEPGAVLIGLGILAKYVVSAGQTAMDRHGGTDRLALDAIGLRLWLSSPSTVATGIGLGVFCQVTPYTSFGVPLILHSTYLWLPVELGVLGLAVAVFLLYLTVWFIRRLRTTGPANRHIALAIVGSLVMLTTWIALNEGSYQRLLWLMLALASVIVVPVRMPGHATGGSIRPTR
jgi:hypothetical protein